MGERTFPPQHQERHPGIEREMTPRPDFEAPWYKPAGKLQGKVALVTGGDSGIGRAVSIMFAKEGADVAVLYLDEHEDAQKTARLVEEEGRRCLLVPGDIGDPEHAAESVERVVRELGRLDILVNNAAEQHHREGVEDVSPSDLERTFRTNIFSMFHLTKAAMPHLRPGSSVINTTSVTAFHGNIRLLDYATTKGAIVAFTRSLSQQLVKKGVRVNAVAPGPVWTPLIPSSFPEEDVETFGSDYPMGPAQPEEIAPTYVFLASEDSRKYSGQTFHPNSGEIVGS